MTINDLSSEEYQTFINNNSTQGYLRIKAYSASEAVPISGVDIVVTKKINNRNITFFEGSTNESGLIEYIPLPTPEINSDNLNAPNYSTYNISATYKDFNNNYSVNLFEDVFVVQNINVKPTYNTRGSIYGS